ncbi:MAG: NUDIX hydrolase [Acidimicrobiia bacterium]|nr:NUDIX hydrolase [Acidimicrobiia bacterium]
MTDGFEVVGSRRLASTDLFSFERLHLVDPEGRGFSRDVLRHTGAVAVVPRIDNDVVLIRQYRAAAGRALLEIPAGKRDVPGEPPEETARRECAEEVGFTPSRLAPLAEFYTGPGFTDEFMLVYQGDDLTAVPTSPVSHEEVAAEIVRISLEDALGLIRSGEIVDAKTIIGLTLAT